MQLRIMSVYSSHGAFGRSVFALRNHGLVMGLMMVLALKTVPADYS